MHIPMLVGCWEGEHLKEYKPGIAMLESHQRRVCYIKMVSRYGTQQQPPTNASRTNKIPPTAEVFKLPENPIWPD